MSIRQILKKLFPETCVNCQSLSAIYVCNKCLKELLTLTYSKHIIDGLDVTSMTTYKGTIKTLFHELKFNRNKRLGNILKHITNKGLNTYLKNHKIDLVIPVPSHKKRIKKRTFNHIDFLLEKNKATHIIRNSIIRNKYTPALIDLNKKQRLSILNNCFTISPNLEPVIKGKNILIYDDIVTSGSTILELEKTLKILKPNSIKVLSTAYVKKPND